MTDTPEQNQTAAAAANTSADQTATQSENTAKSRLSSLIMLLVVVLMAVSTIGYVALNAPHAQETKQAAQEGDDAIDPETVIVAKIDGRNYSAADLNDFIDTLPPQIRQIPLHMILPSLIQQFVNFKLATEAAYAEGLDTDPEVQKQLRVQQDRIVRDTLLNRKAEEAVTDEKLQEAYKEFLLGNPPETEIHARHILVPTEEEAKAIIAELDAGADFAKLASEHSSGPSGANGGDLGYFTRERMVKPFSDAAFALEVGKYTETPVKTEFGYHVIQVEDRRQSKPPALDDVKDKLSQHIAGQVVQAYFKQLREGKDIELFNLDGSPLPVKSDEADGKAPTQ